MKFKPGSFDPWYSKSVGIGTDPLILFPKAPMLVGFQLGAANGKLEAGGQRAPVGFLAQPTCV